MDVHIGFSIPYIITHCILYFGFLSHHWSGFRCFWDLTVPNSFRYLIHVLSPHLPGWGPSNSYFCQSQILCIIQPAFSLSNKGQLGRTLVYLVQNGMSPLLGSAGQLSKACKVIKINNFMKIRREIKDCLGVRST